MGRVKIHVITPATKPSDPFEGERGLILAVFVEALMDLDRYFRIKDREREPFPINGEELEIFRDVPRWWGMPPYTHPLIDSGAICLHNVAEALEVQQDILLRVAMSKKKREAMLKEFKFKALNARGRAA